MTQPGQADDLPAIAGGTPLRTAPFCPPNRYGMEELRELRAALEQGTLFYGQGAKVRQLEAAFAECVGARHAVACSSGTAAIHAALIAAGLSPGDEVIAPPITDMGSILPILWQGGVPRFADLDPHTCNLSPASVEQCITAGTRAILAVHLAGNACDLRALQALAQQHGLTLIEDCAQAHGARYDGRHVGTIGHAGCFSFNEFKHISCGDGGIVVTDDPQLARRLRLATDKGYSREGPQTLRHAPLLANNYRMTELQAAVAIAQLGKLPSIVERRRNWCTRLSEQLAGLKGLDLPRVTQRCAPSWWFYLMRVVPAQLGADADTFAAALRAEGLPVSAHYIGQCVYEYPLLADHRAFDHASHPFAAQPYGPGLCPTAETILQTAVLLSIHEAYDDEQLKQTVRGIRRVVTWFNAPGSDRRQT